jgi:hypothetical protein
MDNISLTSSSLLVDLMVTTLLLLTMEISHMLELLDC